MQIYKWIQCLLVVVAALVYLLYSTYTDVKKQIVLQLYSQEVILAKQAAKGIETLFDTYWAALDSYSKNSHIIDVDAAGKDLFYQFYINNSSLVRSITRVGLNGEVVYTYPNMNLIGANLSAQDHVRIVYQTHKTVLSDIFTSVQGLETAAFHVPVFKDDKFYGSLGILVDYDYIADKYFQGLRIGKGGHALVISEKGFVLFSPTGQRVGKLASNEHGGTIPAALVQEMQAGREGTFDYVSDLPDGASGQGELYHAAFCPVRLYNTFWSICVTAPDSEVLAHIEGFRNRCFAVLFVLSAVGIGFSYYLFRFCLLRNEQIAREKTESALRESETRLTTILESINAGVIVIDPETHTILDLNREASRLIGAPKEEIAGQMCCGLVCPAKQGSCPALEQGQAIDKSEHHLLARNGERIAVLKTVVPIELSGRPVLLESFIDISKRKEAEEALMESEERYRRLFEMESDAIIVTEIETGRILDVNPAAAELYGYRAEEMLQLTVTALSTEPEETLRVILEETSNVELRYHRRKDGRTVPVEIKGRGAELGGKQVNIAAVRDISKRLRAESEKAQLESQLRRAQKLEAIGTLAGGIAHDFNNLLTPIIGYTEMALVDPHLDQRLKGNFEQILQASLRAKDLIKQILASSRYIKEQPKVPVEIGSVIKDALRLLRSSLPATIEIRQAVESGSALADATQIHQIFVNLCTNASHAMDDKGIIDVSLARVDLSSDELESPPVSDLKPGPYLRLSVTDSGCGMDPETLERIFDPYFTTKEVGRGSGLGLAVVDGIVKQHNGAISVRSSPGSGSTFSIYLPRLEEEGFTPGALRSGIPTGTENILLVDDEQGVLDMGVQMLESLGYRVTPAIDGLLALTIFHENSDEFDIVITDYTMPKMTGTDLAREIRRIRPGMAVILCTGFAQKLTEQDARKQGFEFVLKPFGLKELAAVVRKLLDDNKSNSAADLPV
jgi:two-component system, cell cycle sensor histidine kinase and response regulator CckA